MDVKKLIFSFLQEYGRVTTADIVGKTGLSRAYAQRFIKDLADDGKIIRIGKANLAHYVPAAQKGAPPTKPLRVRKIMINRGLAEDKVLGGIKSDSSIFKKLAGNVSSIIDYAFTEMLNNAIEHSGSDKIDIVVLRTATDIRFSVADRGVGIFNNIRRKKRLTGTMDAIGELLKGKETTAPEAHSGEGTKVDFVLGLKSKKRFPLCSINTPTSLSSLAKPA